jgi:predicted enzyme related to lactoylglutathione lyase
MMKLSSVMIGTMQPTAMGQFYEKILGAKPSWQDGDWYGWEVGGTFLTIGEHSEMGGATKDPGRMMINFDSEDVKTDFERMKGQGARVVKEPYEMGGAWIATLADPDGNYFQLMTPWSPDMMDEMKKKK